MCYEDGKGVGDSHIDQGPPLATWEVATMPRSISTHPAESYIPGDLVPFLACPKCDEHEVTIAARTERFVYLRCLACAEIWSEPRDDEDTPQLDR